MVRGVRVACRAVSCALLMLFILTYVFSIIMLSLLKQEENLSDKWSTLPLCMLSLLVHGTFTDDFTGAIEGLLSIDWLNSCFAFLVFMLYVLFSAMTVMNMLIGVLCEIIAGVGE